MPVSRLKTALAVTSLAAGAATLSIPHAASAAPEPSPLNFTCPNGYSGTIVSATPLTPEQIAAACRRGPAMTVRPVTDVRPELIAQEATAVPDRPRDPPGLPVTPGIPVLNCSQSANNPALADLSTAAGAWTLRNPGGTTASTAALSHVSWSLVPGSQWIGPVGGQTNAAAGTWTYTRQVRINPCPQGKAAVLTVAFRADNAATFKLMQGSSVITSKAQGGTTNYGFLPASLTNHTYTFPVGANGVYTVVFEVNNIGGPSGLSSMVKLTR